jgi:hypothetical protein
VGTHSYSVSVRRLGNLYEDDVGSTVKRDVACLDIICLGLIDGLAGP